MNIGRLTRDRFKEFKQDYPIYGTHAELDEYRNEQTVIDHDPRFNVNTMWHPMTDEASIAAYGMRARSMLYAVVYDDPGIAYGDRVFIRGTEHIVEGLKYYNTHTRVEVSRKGA